jgi:hypothetical protein
MFEGLWSIFRRRKQPRPRVTSHVATGAPKRITPPPPPPPPPAPLTSAPPANRSPVTLVFDDGTTVDVVSDPALARRVDYVVSELQFERPEPMAPEEVAAEGRVPVRLMFSDGSTQELTGDSELEARALYFVENILSSRRLPPP